MDFLSAVPFRILLWMVPFFFMLHNMEEVPFMERWSKQLPIKIHPTVSTPQFVVAVSFLTIASFVISYISLNWLPSSTGYLLVLGLQAVLLVNAFVPHLVTTIRFRLYSPGVVTAAIITIPFSAYLFQRAFAEQILNRIQFCLLISFATPVMIASAYLSLQIGKLLIKPNSPSS